MPWHMRRVTIFLAVAAIGLTFGLVVGASPSRAAGSYDGSYAGTISWQASDGSSGSLSFTFGITDGRFSADVGVPVFGNVHLDGSVDAGGLVTGGGSYGCTFSIKLTLSGAQVTGAGSFASCTADGGEAHGSIVNVRRTSAPPAATTPSAPKAPHPEVNAQLPCQGVGYYSYSPRGGSACDVKWATPQFLAALNSIIATWYALHPDVPLGIGDMSKQGGTPPPCNKAPCHKAHQKGGDADIRPIRTDKGGEGVSYKSKAYDLELTRDLVGVILNAPAPTGCKLNVIFNDPRIKLNGVRRDPKDKKTGKQLHIHDDHLHVMFVGSQCLTG